MLQDMWKERLSNTHSQILLALIVAQGKRLRTTKPMISLADINRPSSKVCAFPSRDILAQGLAFLVICLLKPREHPTLRQHKADQHLRYLEHLAGPEMRYIFPANTRMIDAMQSAFKSCSPRVVQMIDSNGQLRPYAPPVFLKLLDLNAQIGDQD